jgi:hypothetical protein
MVVRELSFQDGKSSKVGKAFISNSGGKSVSGMSSMGMEGSLAGKGGRGIDQSNRGSASLDRAGNASLVGGRLSAVSYSITSRVLLSPPMVVVCPCTLEYLMLELVRRGLGIGLELKFKSAYCGG